MVYLLRFPASGGSVDHSGLLLWDRDFSRDSAHTATGCILRLDQTNEEGILGRETMNAGPRESHVRGS